MRNAVTLEDEAALYSLGFIHRHSAGKRLEERGGLVLISEDSDDDVQAMDGAFGRSELGTATKRNE
jgi:hypothetical protein